MEPTEPAGRETCPQDLNPGRGVYRTGILAVGAWGLAWLAPLVLWRGGGGVVGFTYGAEYIPFEILGGTLALATLALALFHGGRGPRDPARLAATGALAAVALWVTQWVSELSQPSWDWQCYATAARAIQEGGNLHGGCYVYPPLLATGLAWLERVLEIVASPLDFSSARGLVYYTWRALQVPLAAGAALLALRQARRWGLGPLEAPALVASLFLVSNPLVRTLRHDQPNLLVLVLVLLAVGWMPASPTDPPESQRPVLAALALALAGHLKVLPLALVLAWALDRRWRALLWTGVFLAALALPLSGWGAHLPWLWEWVAAGQKVAWGEHFRDNSVNGVVLNLVRSAVGDVPRGVGSLASLAAGGAMAVRMARRRGDPDGRAMDALVLTLLAAPVVWEHHYLLSVVPLLWAWARFPARRALLLVAAVLMLAVPTFDVFLLSWHRLAGLGLFLWATRGSR